MGPLFSKMHSQHQARGPSVAEAPSFAAPSGTAEAVPFPGTFS